MCVPVKDEFGEWKFDVMFGVIELWVSLSNGDALPRTWVRKPPPVLQTQYLSMQNVSDSTRIDINVSGTTKAGSESEGAAEEQDLSSWLQTVAQKYNKQPARARQWLKMYVRLC